MKGWICTWKKIYFNSLEGKFFPSIEIAVFKIVPQKSWDRKSLKAMLKRIDSDKLLDWIENIDCLAGIECIDLLVNIA